MQRPLSYTTTYLYLSIFPFQSEETYFRQFISGFVNIWCTQLKLNLICTDNAAEDDRDNKWRDLSPQDLQHDLGPHIKRLPDELIPALQKFLIIAKTNIVSNQVGANLQIQDDHQDTFPL